MLGPSETTWYDYQTSRRMMPKLNTCDDNSGPACSPPDLRLPLYKTNWIQWPPLPCSPRPISTSDQTSITPHDGDRLSFSLSCRYCRSKPLCMLGSLPGRCFQLQEQEHRCVYSALRICCCCEGRLMLKWTTHDHTMKIRLEKMLKTVGNW